MTRLEELIKELPPEIRQKAADILEFLLQKRTRLPKPSPKIVKPEPPLEKDEKYKFTEEAQHIAYARADLLRLYRQAAARAPRGHVMAIKEKFIRAYNLGNYPEIYAILGKTSRQTVERWGRELRKTGDPFDLGPRWGNHRRDRMALSLEQQCCLEAADPPPHDRSLAEGRRIGKEKMKAQGVEDNRSNRTYERFLKKWRSHSIPGSEP